MKIFRINELRKIIQQGLRGNCGEEKEEEEVD